MKLMAPKFWYETEKSFWATCLLPLGYLYGLAVSERLKTQMPPLSKPVICVGNLTLGGAGKTPTVQAVARLLQKDGVHVHIVMRGYGGRLKGPVQVDVNTHDWRAVGDEALMLARDFPVWVARRRPEGAQAAIAAGADVVLLDDGFQNPTLYKNFSIVVVDGITGFGNDEIFPAGPLRENVEEGLSRADAVMVVEPDQADVRGRVNKVHSLPVFSAMPEINVPDTMPERVVAFAGIGRPEKFKQSLEQAGIQVADWIAFPDHHPYTEEDITLLRKKASDAGLQLVTTEKDYMRLPSYMRDEVMSVGYCLNLAEDSVLLSLLREKGGIL